MLVIKEVLLDLKFQVQDCVRLPVHAFKEMYACIRAYSHSGLTDETCHLINQMSKQNTYKTVVYEFDANAGNWEDIRMVCHILVSH